MPACYQLIDKKTGKPEVLQEIDRKMCEAFNQPCDPTKWFHNWHNEIGFRLAIGQSFEDIKKEYEGYVTNPESDGERNYYSLSLEVLRWLEDNYTSNAFYSYHK